MVKNKLGLYSEDYGACKWSIYLAPDEHAAEDNLKPVEEVIADDDDCRASGRPAFIGTDRFDRRRRCAQEPCVHND